MQHHESFVLGEEHMPYSLGLEVSLVYVILALGIEHAGSMRSSEDPHELRHDPFDRVSQLRDNDGTGVLFLVTERTGIVEIERIEAINLQRRHELRGRSERCPDRSPGRYFRTQSRALIAGDDV